MRQNFGKTLMASLLFGLTLFTLGQRPAHAYIDVGTASFVLQALVAGFFGSLLTLTLFWKRVTQSARRFASRLMGRPSDPTDESLP